MSVSGGVNDFVVRFANVNGTGSASANTMFAKAIFRMGVPVSAKNIFPSNIQGLPTWYEVRVNGDGYIGRREGINLMVSVNPQSINEDLKNTMSATTRTTTMTKTRMRTHPILPHCPVPMALVWIKLQAHQATIPLITGWVPCLPNPRRHRHH